MGPVIGTGLTLLTLGLAEHLRYLNSTMVLECPGNKCLDLEVFGYGFRVSMLVKNRGSVIVRDAKAVLTLNDGEQLNGLVNHNINRCNTCPVGNQCGRHNYLVNAFNPHVVSEALAWALPEKPIIIPTGSGNVIYEHITSITPQQRSRLLLFDIRPYDNGRRFVVSFFSEYGALGPVPRPYRVCLRFGDGSDELKELNVEVTVYGEDLREPFKKKLRITLNSLREVHKEIVSGDTVSALKELQKFLVE